MKIPALDVVRGRRLKKFAVGPRTTIVSLLGCACLAGALAYAAAPPANTTIGNQATATYTDSSNTQRTATSNAVVTIVQQVASFTLTTDGQSRPGAPGGQIVFPHTLTNTGNGPDNFNLAVANSVGGNFALTNVALYADANGDGIADNSTPITSTGTLAQGATFKFVAAGIIPAGQTSTQTAGLVVSATGTATGSPAPQQTNNDTVTVTTDAVVNVTKSISAATGVAGSGPYTFTLMYTNVGNNTAVNLTLTDVIPSGMTYVAGSARWSVTGAGTALTDANDGAQGSAPDTITYDYNVTVPGRVTAVIARVQPGESRTLTFQVTIPAAQTAGGIQNTANYTYDPGTGTATGPYPTNTVTFAVTQGAGVSIAGATVPSAVQGATVSFTNVVTNTGNGPDSFDVVVSNTSFPAGTAFQLFRSDGLTPLQDTTGNSTPDTGIVAAAGNYSVVVQALLPPGASGANVNYTANVIATSTVNVTVTANTNDVLTTVVPSSADLTNTRSLAGGATASDGAGVGPEASAIVTATITAGSQAQFVLFVNNTAGAADSFDLSASTVSNFSTGLPSGWNVVFTDTNGTVLTNTGAISAGGNKQINAAVSVPAGTIPGTTNIYFRAVSPTTGSLDGIHDALTVSIGRSLAIIPNNSGQVVAGGTITFSHTISNVGNVLEGDNAVSTVNLTATNSLPGWTAIIYFDANGNGVIDPSETPVTNLNFVSNGGAGIALGESIRLLVKVSAPPNAPSGALDSVTISATTTNGSYTSQVPAVASATDSAAIVISDLQILKEQSLDANIDGVADNPYSIADITTGANPGRGLCYRVTVRNNGAEVVNNVQVFDSTPAFTTYNAAVPANVVGGSAPGVVSVPSNGGTGSFHFNVGSLNPGQQAVVTFAVRIDQ